MYVCMYVYIYIYVYICMYVCMYVCIYIYKHVLCVLFSGLKFHVSDTRISVPSMSRVIVSGDLGSQVYGFDMHGYEPMLLGLFSL
jgi:hypothetical protein